MKELNLELESCMWCPYLRFDEFGFTDDVLVEGWYCQHPELENCLILAEINFDKFESIYPDGFHEDCPLDTV